MYDNFIHEILIPDLKLFTGIGTDRLRESPTTASISLPTLHLTNKMVALPGGAELNLLPANGSRKHPPLAALTGGEYFR